MKIYIGSDHAGYKLKEELKKFLDRKGIDFFDVGTNSIIPVDYPIYAKKVVRNVLKNNQSKGILICGSGTGMSMAANKFKGIRAAICYDLYSAKMARNDNDSNVLCLRARGIDSLKSKKIVSVWLKTKFSKEKRHKRRINLLDKK